MGVEQHDYSGQDVPRGRAIVLGTRPAEWYARWALLLVVSVLVSLVSHVPSPAPARRARPAQPAAHPPPQRCWAGVAVSPCPFSPAELRTAYDLYPLLDRGIDGRGTTVVVLGFGHPKGTPDTSDIRQDVAAYARRFRLPPVALTVDSSLAPKADPNLVDFEAVMDVEIVHAVAPGARIVLLLFERSRGALQYVADKQLGDVVSASLGLSERCYTAAQANAAHKVIAGVAGRGIAVVASAGDDGTAGSLCKAGAIPTDTTAFVELPAADPLVTAVGGTRLITRDFTGKRVDEKVWSSPARSRKPAPGEDPTKPGASASAVWGTARHSSGTGGGYSRFFPRPDFQTGVPGVTDRRGVPDVAAVADGATPIAVIVVDKGKPFVDRAAGTSASAPFWAGLAALAGQQAGRRLGPLNPRLYRIAPQHPTAFHDITVGDNTTTTPAGLVPGFRAGRGWDPATGWGTPDAGVLVPLLADDAKAHP